MMHAILAMGLMGNLNAAEVGDKIQFTKFTIMCTEYNANLAKYWFINLIEKGADPYIKKVSNGECMSLGIKESDNMTGKVVKKKTQILTEKDFDVLAKPMNFEILKVDLHSVSGQKVKAGTQVFWYALPTDLSSYKINK